MDEDDDDGEDDKEEEDTKFCCCFGRGRDRNGMSLDRAKDELEYATNWVRVFKTNYQHLKWLNSYAEINELAAQKISKKFVKTYFDESQSKKVKKDL